MRKRQWLGVIAGVVFGSFALLAWMPLTNSCILEPLQTVPASDGEILDRQLHGSGATGIELVENPFGLTACDHWPGPVELLILSTFPLVILFLVVGLLTGFIAKARHRQFGTIAAAGAVLMAGPIAYLIFPRAAIYWSPLELIALLVLAIPLGGVGGWIVADRLKSD
jgi:hypothetical protein